MKGKETANERQGGAVTKWQEDKTYGRLLRSKGRTRVKRESKERTERKGRRKNNTGFTIPVSYGIPRRPGEI